MNPLGNEEVPQRVNVFSDKIGIFILIKEMLEKMSRWRFY